MKDTLSFSTREEFRKWLSQNCHTSDGIWVLFEKYKTIKADEALEEALCYGWIDGQLKRIGEKSYKKYFTLRRENSKWSEKNKTLFKSLEERGLMTDFGREKVEEAKKNGQWFVIDPMTFSEEQVKVLDEILKQYEPAHSNFQIMSMSVKKTYTRAYFDAKTDAGKEKRIAWIVDRLNNNLKPM